VNSGTTLVKLLSDYLKDNQIDKANEIADTLVEIEEFKNFLQSCDDLRYLYDEIESQLSNKFDILNFKLIRIINGVETVVFSAGDKSYLGYHYVCRITEEGSVVVLLDNEHLDEYEKIHLDSYLEEVLNIIYMKLVLHSLQDATYIDPLTKLKNRLAFTEEMKDIIPLALREKMKIGVVVIDIDRFRAVNDEHGTAFGDDFLKLYAGVIKTTLRSSDIAVRFGGGQFLILYMNISDDETTLKLASQLQESLNDTYLVSPNKDKFQKTVSMGVAMFPDDSEDIHEVVHFANSALSDAKDQGRSQMLQYKHEEEEAMDFFF
jgi:diguanylate cyclase (GGDEF)-like protein